MSPADPPPRSPVPRDRDRSGRPRSNRSRDALGRPLPRGAAGVPRQPDGQPRTPEQAIREAQRFLDEGMPFHAHEVFEDVWKSATAQERDLWRGLAQLAVGLTHARRSNPRGADALLRRGAESIAPYATAGPYGLDIERLVSWSHAAARAARDNNPMPAIPRARRATDR